jgi:hypothetical protein
MKLTPFMFVDIITSSTSDPLRGRWRKPLVARKHRYMQNDFEKLSEIELLQLHALIVDELKRREVVRTKNNPIGDYTEWLVAKALNLQLARNSSVGYDGKDVNGIKYQIKGRRLTLGNKSRQLSAIRNLAGKDFDVLVGLIFDETYQILIAVQIPHAVVEEYAEYREHVNGHILHLRGKILEDERVRDIRNLFDA